VAERLYSVDQAAALLGTSPREIRRWIDVGHLPAEQLAGDVRVSERGLVRFITARGIDLGKVLSAALPREPEADAVARLAEAVLADAVRRGADAILLEPVANGLTLKLRVGGRVREKPRFASHLPAGLGPRLLARFRAMAQSDGPAGRPARFSVRLNGNPHTFRLEGSDEPHGPGLAIYPVADGD